MEPVDVDCPARTAWAIHIFTATGVVAGFLGLLSVLDGSPRAALTWFLVAMIIDGLDGPIARHYDIGRVIPHIDGNALDLMIDYVCCVVAPALFMQRFRMFPGHHGLSLVIVGLVLMSSLYVMSNKNIQTEDRYFNGFPSMWNLVVNVLFVLQSQKWVNVAVVLALVVFSFVPVKFIHPIRVRDFRKITIPVLVVWLGAMLYITWILDDRTQHCSTHCLSAGPEIAQGLVYAGAVWIVGVGLWRTVRGRPSDHPGDSKEAAAVRTSTGVSG